MTTTAGSIHPTAAAFYKAADEIASRPNPDLRGLPSPEPDDVLGNIQLVDAGAAYYAAKASIERDPAGVEHYRWQSDALASWVPADYVRPQMKTTAVEAALFEQTPDATDDPLVRVHKVVRDNRNRPVGSIEFEVPVSEALAAVRRPLE